MANVKIKVDPQETKGVKLNTTATAMTITAVGDIGSGGGDEEDTTNKLYYFRDLKNGDDGSFPITLADLEEFEFRDQLTAVVNGVKYPAQNYNHPRGYIPYFSIYPTDEMVTKYDLHVDTDSHQGTIFDIAVEPSGASLIFGTNVGYWAEEVGVELPESYHDPMPILNITIYEEIAADDECCIIGIVYDTETNKWKFDGEDDPLDLIDFVMGLSNKNGHPRSYYRERVFYKIDFKNTENRPLDVIYLNAFEKYSERTDEDRTTTLTLRSTSNYVTLDYEDSTVVLEIVATDTMDSTTYEVTRSHSITVKVGGSQFPTV